MKCNRYELACCGRVEMLYMRSIKLFRFKMLLISVAGGSDKIFKRQVIATRGVRRGDSGGISIRLGMGRQYKSNSVKINN